MPAPDGANRAAPAVVLPALGGAGCRVDIQDSVRHYNRAACPLATHNVPGSEMLDTLRARWRTGLSFDELIALSGELDAILHRIRAERHIRPPVFSCSCCGHVGEAAEPTVTVRATILSLGRFGIAPAQEVKDLEKRWAAHRRQEGLDLYGRTAAPAEAAAPTCNHSAEPD